ncbi:MAG: hypothetical protein ACRELU_13355 [Gemmatimonadota bacterium]
MKTFVLALIAAAAVTPGCRSSEESAGAATASPSQEQTSKTEEARRDELDRYEARTQREVAREDARRQEAEERDRRIDEEPVEHPPQPPVEEAPPK